MLDQDDAVDRPKAFGIHPERAAWLDRVGRDLASMVTRRPREQPRPGAVASSAAHRPVPSISVDDTMNAQYWSSEVDDLGQRRSHFVLTPTELIGFDADTYPRFMDVVFRLAEQPDVRDTLSRQFIERTVFDWAVQAHLSGRTDSPTIAEHFVSKANESIERLSVLVPISYLSIESRFRIGNVDFDYLAKEFWDRYEARARSQSSHPPEVIDALVNDRRKKYQGTVVTSVTLVAEKRRAVQIALRETDKALAVLRVFSPSVLVLGIPAYFEKMGYAHIPTSHHIFVYPDGAVGMETRLQDERQIEWTIRNSHLADMRRVGLDIASDLMAKEPESDLEKALVAAISMFSKGIASQDMHDRFVFILASMETLLLKDPREPVQAALADRLALLSGQTVDERLSIQHMVKSAYDRRSQYLHHGVATTEEGRPADLDMLKALQYRSWVGLTSFLQASRRLRTRAEVIDLIEREKFK